MLLQPVFHVYQAVNGVYNLKAAAFRTCSPLGFLMELLMVSGARRAAPQHQHAEVDKNSEYRRGGEKRDLIVNCVLYAETEPSDLQSPWRLLSWAQLERCTLCLFPCYYYYYYHYEMSHDRLALTGMKIDGESFQIRWQPSDTDTWLCVRLQLEELVCNTLQKKNSIQNLCFSKWKAK